MSDGQATRVLGTGPASVGSWPTPQQELLLRAALTEGPRAVDAWVAWEREINWDDHLEEGSYRLLPLAYENLQSEGFGHPIMQKLKGIYRLAWYRNHTGLTRLAAVLKALRASGVPTLVLKGSALLATHYKSYGLRPMSDGDVLVPRQDVGTAIGVLTSIGWKVETIADGVPLDELISSRHAVTFLDEQGNQIDLHWHTLVENCQPGADDAFWEGSVEITLAGEPTRALNPTDQLLHVCVHGARWNELPSIRWVADAIVILRQSSKDIDWDRLLRQAHDRLLVLPVRATITYLRHAFDAPVPDDFLRRVQSEATSRQERLEFKYRNRDHRGTILGYLPVMWFDYLRTRPPLSNTHRVWGFANYLKLHVGAPSILLVPPYLAFTSQRVRRFVGFGG